MASPPRPLVQWASAIHAELAAATTSTRLVDLPTESWRRSERLVRQVRRAELHGWHLAADELRRQLRYALSSVQSHLAELLTELGPTLVRSCRTTFKDVYEDLVALEREFDTVTFCRQSHLLCVTTEPITLEGVHLGSFEIRLHWQRLSARSKYHVVALEPHPAASRESVTHPHVLDEALCEGEGHRAIRQALAEGRLLDFFTVVAGILRTYNDESAFVALAVWEGRNCDDCGALVSDDEWSACHHCGDAVCDECLVSCGGCGNSHCNSCLVDCRDCQDGYCRNCIQVCGDCRRNTCQNCLEDERCQHCHENHRVETDEASPPAEESAVHTDGLGQIVVPA
jgi:hypothetical protein